MNKLNRTSYCRMAAKNVINFTRVLTITINQNVLFKPQRDFFNAENKKYLRSDQGRFEESRLYQ